MEIIFLFCSITLLLVASVIAVYLIRGPSFEKLKKINLYLLLLSFLYIIFSIISLLWAIKPQGFENLEFLILFTIVIFLQSLILTAIIFEFSKKRKIFLILLSYVFCIPAIILSPNLIVLVGMVAYLVQIAIFSIFLSYQNYKIPSYIMIIYSIYSLGFYTLFSLGLANPRIFLLSSSILFLIFITIFTKNLKSFKLFIASPKKSKDSYIVSLLKHFIFLVVLTNFLFIGTLSFHEFGHMGTARILGCSEIKIVYENTGIPYTEILCEDINKTYTILGGVLLPLIIAILLFFVGGHFMKESSLMIAGFNLMISYRDFLSLNISQNISLFITFCGAALALFGLIQLTRSRTTEDYFEFS